MKLTYEALKEGVLELYLSVKIRSDEEIDNYNENVFLEEKRQMKDVDGYTLIDHIKSAIEVLMNMKVEEQDEMENPDLFTRTSQDLLPINRHEMSQRLPDNRARGDRGHFAELECKDIDIKIGGAEE